MSRILAIDYGRKRTGIAVTDPMQIIANGLTTVPTHKLVDFLLDYVGREKVERIVVGHPKQMNNEDSESMRYIVPFLNRLKKVLPEIPVEHVADPDHILLQKRTVQPHPLPQGRDICLCGHISQHSGSRVTGNQMNQQKYHHGNHKQHRDHR